jgi:hypothetical protein
MPLWTRRRLLRQLGGLGLGLVAGACGRMLETLTPPSSPTPRPFPSPTPWPSPTATAIPTDTPIPPSPTPAPTPTKTPWPPFPRPSKLGIVVQWFRDVHIVNLIVNTRMRVVKIIDDFGRAPEIKAASPNTVLIGRITHNHNFGFEEHLRDGRTDMRAAAEWYVNRFMEIYLANPLIDYWEGHNEPRPHNHEVMRLFAQFEIERMQLMAQRGLRCAIGNFPNGSPDLELWVDFLPALRTARQLGGILALHEYASPTLDAGVDPQTGEGWFTLRYRKVYRYMVPREYQIPIVITELGIDDVPTFQGPPSRGWRNYLSYWAQRGFGIPITFTCASSGGMTKSFRRTITCWGRRFTSQGLSRTRPLTRSWWSLSGRCSKTTCGRIRTHDPGALGPGFRLAAASRAHHAPRASRGDPPGGNR